MTSAGGVFYHLRALHAARSGWAPFRDGVGAWLRKWPASGDLVLVGSSAAYCLEPAVLRRFASLHALEPDAVARALFARKCRRSGAPRPTFEPGDLLLRPLLSGGRGLDHLLAERPGASVLFCNVLGQLPYLLRDAERPAWQRAWLARVAPALAGRPWASFHDRVSAAVPPALDGVVTWPERLGDDVLASRFYGHVRGRLELTDHGTEGLFPPTVPHAYLHWPIEPGAHHVIEAVRSE